MKPYRRTARKNFDHVPYEMSPYYWSFYEWPYVFVAALTGIAFEMTIAAVTEIRRKIYNRARNLKHTSQKNKKKSTSQQQQAKTQHRKNQAWRTTPKGRGYNRWSIPFPIPPDFAKDLCKQWDKVHDSLEEMLKFGDMLIELEDYVDNSFVHDIHGNIIRRGPGIKGFLSLHCPHIVYTTAMRYRALALKAKEAEKKGKLHAIRKECTTIDEFTDTLDSLLHVEFRSQRKRHKQQYPDKDRTPQPDIFAIRDEALSAYAKLSGDQRNRYVAALLDLIHELSS